MGLGHSAGQGQPLSLMAPLGSPRASLSPHPISPTVARSQGSPVLSLWVSSNTSCS